MVDFMITLSHFPKNKDKFVRLVNFFTEVLDICSTLDVALVLNGSLAVFAYTENQEMNVNDVDLSCSETEFPRIMNVLEERNTSYKLKEWHVLQILRDDLKIELDSMEYWYKSLPMEYETLQLDSYKINILSLNSLKEFYRQGLKDGVNKTEENEKIKYEDLKLKFEALEKIKN